MHFRGAVCRGNKVNVGAAEGIHSPCTYDCRPAFGIGLSLSSVSFPLDRCGVGRGPYFVHTLNGARANE